MSSAAATAGAIKSEPVQYTGPAITIPAPPSAAALTSSAAAAIPSLAAEEEARQRSVRVSQRLRTHAFQSQLLSKHTIHDSHDVLSMKRARIPTKLQLGETVDVIQKSGSSSSSSGSQRGTKRKVLMLLPFRISCSASGKQVGWLTQLNTSNPCMYIHFPLVSEAIAVERHATAAATASLLALLCSYSLLLSFLDFTVASFNRAT